MYVRIYKKHIYIIYNNEDSQLALAAVHHNILLLWLSPVLLVAENVQRSHTAAAVKSHAATQRSVPGFPAIHGQEKIFAGEHQPVA